MKEHIMNVEEVIKKLCTSSNGLSSKDAKMRLEEYGPNQLKEEKKKTLLQRFIAQFKDAMILVLLAAAGVSLVVAIVEGNPKELFEPFLILLIVVLNAVMGVMQENKAEKALEALASMSSPHARVKRDGKEMRIDSKDVVVGDLMILEAGDFICADGRLINSSFLKCEESALTGESVPVDKDHNYIAELNSPLGDRENMVYSGCLVANGHGEVIVTSTGMNTEMGKIAGLLSSESEVATPLQLKLSQLGKYLGILAIFCCMIIFVVGIINGIPALEIFMTSISLAVSAIPEGLPAIVTVVLSIGVGRLVEKNAIIRKLPAVETLGSASVICSDKTGTLTLNQMTVMKVYNDSIQKEEDANNSISNESKELLKMMTLCTDASIIKKEDGYEQLGDPTETAILMNAVKHDLDKDKLNSEYPRLSSIPFDSDRKLMTTIHSYNNKTRVIVKGAFDVLSKKCISGDISKAKEINDTMSASALRVLALAYKDIDQLPKVLDSNTIENNLHFVGLIGMIDPPRKEAKEAVKLCKIAGIKPIMITGDHVITARAIAKELGIYNEGDLSITGAELDLMNDSELNEQIEKISVYARVSPENKIRIVKHWQKKNHVVAMTGDGVNDAPALKAADIGCAMGITGTDVAKGAADLTLTDDNFATIVEAVREGRGIYANIKKVVGYLLGTNIGEVICVFASMLLWHTSPLLSMQLLWINLITDSLPAIALGMEDVEEDIMSHKPKPKNEGLFANGFGLRTVLQGIMFGVLSLIAFVLGKNLTGTVEGGRTLTFMVLALSQIVQSFNMRSSKSLFKIGFFTNSTLNKAVIVSLGLTLIVLFTPLSSIFSLVQLPVYLYIYGFALALVPLVVMELSKALNLIKE